LPAEKLDRGGKAVFKEIIKKAIFEARTDQEHDNIYEAHGRNSGRASSCISSAFGKMVALGAGKLDIGG
jgi:hypothetical protein